MIQYDAKTRRYYDDATGEWCDPPARDHTQNPLIGIALLLFVFWVAYQMTSLYYGGINIVWVP